MFLRVLRIRRVLAVVTGVAVLGFLPACGPDLGKANFPRATLAVQDAGQVPTGEITDPAVAFPALRVVDPCPLVGKAGLADLGTPNDPISFEFDRCANQVKDAGGKTIKVNIVLGDLMGGASDKVTGTVEGLPQVEEKIDSADCNASAFVSRAANLGITIMVNYDGGDPCRPAVIVLQKVIQRLHDNPSKYTLQTGTVLPLDPCSGIDAAVVEEVAPEPKQSVTGLHNCTWTSHGGPQVTLDYRRGFRPTGGDGYQQVDLGGGVVGFQELGKADGNGSHCTVRWQHRPLDQDTVETVNVEYLNYSAEQAKDEPCGKVVKLAKDIVPKLPKP